MPEAASELLGGILMRLVSANTTLFIGTYLKNGLKNSCSLASTLARVCCLTLCDISLPKNVASQEKVWEVFLGTQACAERLPLYITESTKTLEKSFFFFFLHFAFQNQGAGFIWEHVACEKIRHSLKLDTCISLELILGVLTDLTFTVSQVP